MSELLSAPTTKRGQLQRAVLNLLLEHERKGELPTNNRFLFYELEHLGVVSKRATGKRRADQDTADATFWLRDRGAVPWNWIVDETRELYDWQHAASIADYLTETLALARINPWAGSAPLILCESRTFGGVLRRSLAAEYLRPIAATNGQAGGFLRTDVAPLLKENDRRVLYIGDLDLAGDHIERNTHAVLEREADRPLDWRRLALTVEQAEEYGLEPILKTDGRYKDKKPHEAIEVEALGQSVVTGIVRSGLDALLPCRLEDVLEREHAQREHVGRLLRGIKAGGAA